MSTGHSLYRWRWFTWERSSYSLYHCGHLYLVQNCSKYPNVALSQIYPASRQMKFSLHNKGTCWNVVSAVNHWNCFSNWKELDFASDVGFIVVRWSFVGFALCRKSFHILDVKVLFRSLPRFPSLLPAGNHPPCSSQMANYSPDLDRSKHVFGPRQGV